ncbi:zinc finger protein 1035 [Genypterus blacodes]|uniref:zinc finger protein 1035 n=1 Tax=Genypterus blacodes TaxID=154954 RepID=UPI003F77500F
MAHGWDSYFQSLESLPSDPTALRGSSESEGSFPQHIENLIGDHDFSNTAASQEAPAKNSDFNTHFYTDPTVGNADCDYQRYYGEMPWQATGEQMMKDCLPRCANSNISDFAPDGMSTAGFHSSFAPDFQELKQDCEMLTPSFHGDYSDVNRDSDADVGETRPSCKFMTSNSGQNPKTADTKTIPLKHTSSEWPFTSTENTPFPNESLCPYMSETTSLLSNTSDVEGENMVQCSQGEMESLEKPCTQSDQFPAMSNIVTNTENEIFEGSNVDGGGQEQCQEDAGEEMAVTQGKESVPPKSCHENVTSQRVKENPDDCEDDHNVVIATNGGGQEQQFQEDVGEETVVTRGKESNPMKSGHENVASEREGEYLDGSVEGHIAGIAANVCGHQQQCQRDVGEEMAFTQGKESDTLNSSHENLTRERIKEYLDDGEENHKTVIATKSMAISDGVELDDLKVLRPSKTDSNKQGNDEFNKEQIRSLSSTYGQDGEDENDVQDKEIKTLAFQWGNSEEEQVGDIFQNSMDTSESIEQGCKIPRDGRKESNKQADKAFDKQETPHPNSTDGQDLDMRNAEEDKTIQTLFPKSSDLHGVMVLASENTEHELSESTSAWKSSNQDVESCLQLPKHQSMESKAVNSICRNPADGSDRHPVNPSDKELNFSDRLPCLLTNASSMDTRPSSESKNTAHKTNITSHQSLQPSPVAIETECLCRDVSENPTQSFHLDAQTKEKELLPNVLHGEHLPEEETCEADQSKTRQLKESSDPRLEDDSMSHVEKQTSHLKSSAQMRKRLQPIVIMKTPEPTSATNTSYHCAGCQHTTHSVDHLIKHYHCSHLKHKFQFCQTCNIYMIRNEHTEQHLCGVPNATTQLPFDSHLQKGKKRHGRYTCNSCILVFATINDYVRHMRAHTGQTPYKCNQCGSYFSQSCSLNKHKRIPGRCNRKRKKKSLVTDSDAVVNLTKPKEIEIETTEDLFEKSPVPRLKECYVKLVDIYKRHVCHVCGKQYSTAKQANKHYYNLHKHPCSKEHTKKVTIDEATQKKMIGKYKCPLCPQLFKYSHNRARHLQQCVRRVMYGGKGKFGTKYKCPLCPASFTLSSNRYRHVKNSCIKECLIQLAVQRAKETAIQTALQKKKHNCSFCPAVFAHKSGKYRHMKKHKLFQTTGKLFSNRKLIFSPASIPAASTVPVASTTVKTEECNETSLSVSCRFCGKGFSTSASLKKHQYYHKGEKPYRCLECGKKFKKHAYLISHKMVHQRRIQCTVCRKILPTIGELIQHRNSHLKKGTLQCPDCPMQFQYPACLLKHSASHKNGKDQTQQAEEKPRFQTEQSLASLKENDELNQHQCSLCKNVFDDAQALRAHCLKHISQSSSYKCPFCKRDFTCRHTLLRHMTIHTGAKPLSCGTCGKRFFRNWNFKLHLKKCSPIELKHVVTSESNKKSKEFNCSICPRTFGRRHRLRNHHRGHKENSLLCCLNCGRFYGYTKLTSHQKSCLQTSEGSTGFSRDEDEKTNKQTNKDQCSQYLQSTATEMLKHKCPHCPLRYKYRSVLLRHVVSHTGLQPYSCMHCGQRYASQTMCLQHEAFCDGVYRQEQTIVKSNAVTLLPAMSSFREAQKPQAEGEFKCKFCTKTFMKPRYLRRHILTHTEVKPYHCKACDCCFSRYDHLKVHQAHCKGKRQRLQVCIPKISLDDVGKGWQNTFGSHSLEKRQAFQCNVCSRTFSVQSELLRHVTMFHATKSFRCTHCGKSYSHESSLKKHKKQRRCRKHSTKRKAAVDPPTEDVTKVVTNRILQRIQPSFTKKYKHVCSYCPRAFHNSWQLRVHTRLHTGERPYSCDDCGEKFIRNDYLQRHWPKCTKRVVQTTRVLCERCGSLFSKDEIENHRKICIAPAVSKPKSSQMSHSTPLKGYSCAYCSSNFLLFSQLQEHFLNTHKLDTLSNPAASAVPLQQHLSTLRRIKEEPLEEKCDEHHSDGANVLCNLDPCLKAEIQKSFVCTHCNLRFINKAGLHSHLRTHSTSRHHYTCTTCKKGFWNKCLLRNHSRKCLTLVARTGTTLKPTSLDLNESFLVLKEEAQTTGTGRLQTNSLCNNDTPSQKSKGDQNQSNSSVQKVVQYQCSECEKSFTDGLLLISHLEDHGRQEQEKKRNTCSKCRRVCSSQANLERHMRMHGIKEKYSCPDCSKKFDTRVQFEAHRTCHDPNRSFACRVCNQRFLTKQELLSHYSEEHPNEIFSCHICKRIYSAKETLLKHYRMWHKDEQKDDNIDNTVHGMGSIDHQPSSPDSTTDESDGDGHGESSGSDDSDTAPYFPCHVCGKTFTTSESLEDHQRCHLGEKPHECAECGRCFYQASQLQQHQRMHKSEHQCQTCGRGFVSLFALRKHKHSHGKSRPHRCPKCQLSFTGPAQLAEHMSTHREETFPCDICDRIFSSKSSRAEHRKMHSKAGGRVLSLVPPQKQEKSTSPSGSSSVSTELKYRCGICSSRFNDPEELSEHGCLAAKERSYSCLDCKKHFLHASHLKKHQATHHCIPSHSGTYPCNQCSTSFSSHQHFLNHLKKHDNADGNFTNSEKHSRVFKCPVCHQNFAKTTDLMRHFPVHSQGAFECEICKTTFSSKSKLDEHGQCHLTAVSQFECTVCGQSFLGRDAFRQHHCSHKHSKNEHLNPSARKSPVATDQTPGEDEEIDVTGYDLHNCPVCSKWFPSQSGLLEHQNKFHPNEKPFKCKLCGKSFALKHYLKEHEQRHRLKLPAPNEDHPEQSKFECSYCSKMFNTEQDLSLHMRMHAEKDVGAYRCDMCYKSFTQWSRLKQHQESHVGQVVYECTECDKAFAFPHLLEEHQHTHSQTSV